MNFYTYSTPGACKPPESVGGDLCKEEVWKDYVDCGMTMFMLTGDNGYFGGGWENSQTKKCFDFANKFGIERVIFDDNRIMDLIALQDKLIGEGEDCKFASEMELDAFVKVCMSEYINEKNFYGLRLRDEPNLSFLKAYGEVYRSVKRVAKELGKDYIYIQVNLLPLEGDHSYIPSGWEGSVGEAYEHYIDAFLAATGADIISIDNYPFRPSYSGGRFLLGYYTCFQIFRKVCDKYNATMSFAMQSFEMIHKTSPEARAGYRRITSINEMMLQMNSALGFGARDLSFYTYVTMASSEDSLYRTADGSSFITWKGDKTRIYEFAKAAIAHAKRLEEVLFAYDFKGSNIFVHECCPDECRVQYLGDAAFSTHGAGRKGAEFDTSYVFRSAKNLSNDSDVMLVTEFEKTGDSTSRLLMVQNVLDTVYKTNLKPMHVTVDFGLDCKRVKVFKTDVWEIVDLKNGVYETELVIGEAVYLIPLQ